MAGEDFLKFNNGQKFSFSNFKEIKEEDLKNADAETKHLFNIFAGDDKILQADEAQSLWNKIKTAAANKKNSVFDNDEMQKFLNKDKDIKAAKTKFSIDALTNMISQVFAVHETNSTLQPTPVQKSLTDDDLVQYTPEEIENISVETLSDDVSNARKLYDAQNNEQGSVSKFVNAAKETFDTELASSRVDRYIRKEELCVDLLKKSKSEEGLSQKEYLEAKIDFVMSLIQDLEQYSLRTEITQDSINIALRTFTFGLLGDKKTKNSQELETQKAELEHLKSILARLSLEEINAIIAGILSFQDEADTNMVDFSFGGKTNIAKPQKMTCIGSDNKVGVTPKLVYSPQASEGSLTSLSKVEAYKKMSFEETFQKERGIEYNSEAVMDYTQKDSYMQFLLGIHNRREQLGVMLKEARFIKTTRGLGSEQMPGEIQNNARVLMDNLTNALKTVYGNDAAKIQEFIDSIYPNVDNTRFASINKKPEVITNEQGEFVRLSFSTKGETIMHPSKNREKEAINLPNLNMKLDDLTINSMINIADKLQANIDATYDKALNGKTIEEYGEEVKEAYTKAYGSGDSQAIANAYVQSQQDGVGYVKAGVSTIGMAVMIAGQLVPIGGQAAAAMVYGGLATATLGSSAVTAIELLTKEGKVKKEEWQELAKEVATSLALTLTGMKSAKISEGVYLAVARHCPKLVALASEIGVDATISLIADLAITGDIDLSGESIAQLQSVLVGILHAKGNFKNYLDTHAGDASVKTDPNNIEKAPTPKGKVATLDEAKTTNPAENAEKKVRKEWQTQDLDKEVENNGPVITIDNNGKVALDLSELDSYKASENVVKDEVNDLIFKGQLGNTISEIYNKLGKSFEDVITKHSHEISKLEQTYGKDKQQFAQKFTDFLADKLGVNGITPKIVIEDMSDCDGFFDWVNGELVINKNLTNAKDLETIIAHEFVHVLQFKDIVAAKGQDGVREIYLNEKGGRFIEAKTKEILEANGIDYDNLTPGEKADYKDAIADMLADQTIADNVGLVQFAQNNPIENGSLKSYLAKLYQDEHTNIAKFDTPEYYSQIIENEAYYLGNGRIGDRIASNTKLSDIQMSDNLGLNLHKTSSRLGAKGKITQESIESEIRNRINSICSNPNAKINLSELERVACFKSLKKRAIAEIEEEYGASFNTLSTEYPDEIFDILKGKLDSIDLQGILINAAESKKYAFMINENGLFTPYNLSLNEIHNIKMALEYSDFNEIDNILRINNPEVFATLGSVQRYSQELKTFYNRLANLSHYESTISTQDLGVEVNGKNLVIKTSENIPQKPVASLNDSHYEELIKSNILTMDCIEIMLDQKLPLPDTTVKKNTAYKTSLQINIKDNIEKAQRDGFSSLTSYETHVLTDFFKDLYYSNSAFKTALTSKVANKSKRIYSYVNGIKYNINKILTKPLTIREHCIMRMLDRDIYNPINNTNPQQIVTFNEMIKTINDRALSTIKEMKNSGATFTSFIINEYGGSGIEVLLKTEDQGKTYIIDTIIQK